MATPITSLTGSDTFQTWFNTTNSIISRINGITANDIAGSTGIGITLSSTGIATISNTGVVSFNGSTGSINFNAYVSSLNGATGVLTGVTGVAAGTGISITGTTRPTITNTGVISINGSGGSISNVAKLDIAQTFSGIQEFSAGITGVLSYTASVPTIASATTISITTPIAFISGSVTIQTINAPSSMSAISGQITLIPSAGAGWSTNTSGNIALGTTAVVNKALIMTWNSTTAKWYPSY